MNLIELKEKADRWLKMQSMIMSLEAEISAIDQMLMEQAEQGLGEDEMLLGRLKQMQVIYEKCQMEIQALDGDRQEYEKAWEEKRKAVEAADGDAWAEIKGFGEEIFKIEARVQMLTKVLEIVDKEGKTPLEDDLRELYGQWLAVDDQNQMGEDMIPNLLALRAEEIEKLRSMEEVIQWLVIEA